ncbi:MAG: DUF4954 family protein [Caldithrix sp.]|nr:DUF4954 family protein [Caldithrix sp.]
MAYRTLKGAEIEQLKKQNCKASDWHTIFVKEAFVPDYIEDVRFFGEIRLGVFNKSVPIDAGIQRPAGIYNCTVQDCVIDDNVYALNVNNLVNYHIDAEAIIHDVHTLSVSEPNTFGNGTEIEILNEGGGRELKIFDRLSAQIAYLNVLYRHDRKFINQLERIIDNYIKTQRSDKGWIGFGSRIFNCATIQNVRIGPNAVLSGIKKLHNGTIVSNKEAPVYMGDGIIAENFIVQSGSTIDNGAILSNCFVGQSVTIGKQFSVENSAFFANSEGFHGEACSIFAGPYTVTHHKSTLLIAGLFSFYNAGSGTNQSNHMYKLGPVHQGILERGCKTGSFSYLLWPSRVGAFSAVIGKHYANFDGSDFPFSYINEEDGKSVLTPAMNLFTVGTRRDSAKWPLRDKRTDTDKLDIINFDLFSPYTIAKALKGKSLLLEKLQSTPREKEYVQIKGLFIKRLLLKRCAKYYDLAISIFLGQQLAGKIKSLPPLQTLDELKAQLLSDSAHIDDQWVDVAGMLTPKSMVNDLMSAVKRAQIKTITAAIEFLQQANARYATHVWAFTIKLCSDLFEKRLDEFQIDDFLKIISDWSQNQQKLNSMILADAQKEFNATSRIGFGIDGTPEEVDLDFEQVRGSYADNNFVKDLQAESQSVQKQADETIRILESLKVK